MYQRAASGAPEHLGRYELVTRLATGGMGEIYLARLRAEGGFDKLIALKLLLPELVASERFTAMFLDEARIASRLSHPNVCEIYELGRDRGRYFIAMQYLQGLAMSELCAGPDGLRDCRLLASLVIQACEGLHHAHELRDGDGAPLGVVHRDVSPSNLFVTFDGVLKVLDFGIAKAHGATSRTARDEIKGKYAYMSPEQLRGEELDRRSDVFGLGIVLFETLSGRRLFGRESDFLAAKAIIEEPIPRLDQVAPEVPPALAEVVATALQRSRDQRYASARALADALRDALEDCGGTMDALAIGRELRDRFGDRLAAQARTFAEASALGRAVEAAAAGGGAAPAASEAAAAPAGDSAGREAAAAPAGDSGGREAAAAEEAIAGEVASGSAADGAGLARTPEPGIPALASERGEPEPLARTEAPTRPMARRRAGAASAPGSHAAPRRRWPVAAAALAIASAAAALLVYGLDGSPTAAPAARPTSGPAPAPLQPIARGGGEGAAAAQEFAVGHGEDDEAEGAGAQPGATEASAPLHAASGSATGASAPLRAASAGATGASAPSRAASAGAGAQPDATDATDAGPDSARAPSRRPGGRSEARAPSAERARARLTERAEDARSPADAARSRADAEPGYFSVDSQPYATIYRGERELGVTPLIRQPLPPGRHELRAVTARGDERRFVVVIRPGRTAPPVQLRW